MCGGAVPYGVDKAVKKVHNVIAKSNRLQQCLIAVVIWSVIFRFLPNLHCTKTVLGTLLLRI